MVKSMNLNPLKGMRDFEPMDMILREDMITKIKKVFERYGFDPLETPAVESLDILSKKYGEDEKLIWKFKDMGGRDVALRYDLTVPLARFIAKKKRIPMPFKRYQIGRVWRYDNPQRGRYREFWQCDIDTVGSSDLYFDAEILGAVNDSLKSLGIQDFVIKINNRKFSNGILEYVGVPKEKIGDALRSIDKLEKIGVDGVSEELTKKNLDADKIIDIINTDPSKIPDLNDVGEEGRKELFTLADYLKKMKVRFKIDLTIVRGLDYYTGTVYEASVPNSGVGSISGGGRYDNLIGVFLGTKIPAVGGSLGIERIFDILEKKKKTRRDILVIPVGVDKIDIVSTVEKLREKFNVDVSSKKNISKGIKYAESVGINYVCIIGRDEISKNKLKIKNLKTGKEALFDEDNVDLGVL